MVSKELSAKGKSLVFDTIVTFGAFMTSFPSYSQFSNKNLLFPFISPDPTSNTFLLTKKSESIFFTNNVKFLD